MRSYPAVWHTDQLMAERAEILASIHLTYEELVERHEQRDMNSREWDAWDRIKAIDWLVS